MPVASLGALCAFLSSVTWAWGSTAYASLAARHAPLAINMTRALVALPLFLLTTLGQVLFLGFGTTGLASLTGAKILWIAASMVSSYAVGDTMFLFACRRLGVPVALAVSSIYPIWSAAAGWAFQGEALGGARALGVALCVGGVVAAVLSAPRHEEDGRPASAVGDRLAGAGLALVTSLFWALNTYAIARGGEGLSFPATSFLRMLVAALLIALLGLATTRRVPRPLSWADLKPHRAAVVVECYGGSSLFVVGMTMAPLAVGAPLSSLSPVVSIPFALLARRERFSLARTAAVAAVVAGIVFLVR